MGQKKPKHPSSAFGDRGSHKAPRSSFVDTRGKTPRGGVPDYAGQFPLWAFRIVDLGGPWCWSVLGGTELRNVLQRMKDVESMTWQAIGETGSHFIDVSGLAKAARDRLMKIHQDDVDQVYSLRVGARERIFGIRDGGVLRVLWWDPQHQVCPSPKKHT
jgi:hypothetical protein